MPPSVAYAVTEVLSYASAEVVGFRNLKNLKVAFELEFEMARLVLVDLKKSVADNQSSADLKAYAALGLSVPVNS